MNKELDKLLCLLDSKITTYRIRNKEAKFNRDIVDIQHDIQLLWSKNKVIAEE